MQFLTVKLFSAVGSPWATGLSGHIHLLCVHPPWVAVNIYCGGVSLTGSREYLFGSWSTSSLSFSAPGASPAASYSLSSPLLSFCHFLTFLNYFFFFFFPRGATSLAEELSCAWGVGAGCVQYRTAPGLFLKRPPLQHAPEYLDRSTQYQRNSEDTSECVLLQESSFSIML